MPTLTDVVFGVMLVIVIAIGVVLMLLRKIPDDLQAMRPNDREGE